MRGFGLALIYLIASSRSEKVLIGKIGPKISSVMSLLSSEGFSMTVGSKNFLLASTSNSLFTPVKTHPPCSFR